MPEQYLEMGHDRSPPPTISKHGQPHNIRYYIALTDAVDTVLLK
jgi:hypothetical protein